MAGSWRRRTIWHVHELGGYAIWAEREIGEARPWLTAVPPWVHFKNVCYHVRAAEVLGFHAAVLLTGHYGPNWEDLKTLVDLLQPWVRMRLHGLPDFEANRPGFPGDGADGDHAGKVETSQLWALEPEGVDLARIPVEPVFPLFAMGKDAAAANREAGERMVAGYGGGTGGDAAAAPGGMGPGTAFTPANFRGCRAVLGRGGEAGSAGLQEPAVLLVREGGAGSGIAVVRKLALTSPALLSRPSAHPAWERRGRTEQD